MTEEERAQLQRILDAWTEEGPVPSYHRAWQERLHRSWPTLATALDDAARRRKP